MLIYSTMHDIFGGMNSRLLALPVELQECIVLRICTDSIESLLSLKQTCKALKEVSDMSSVYASANLLRFTYNQLRRGAVFMKRCYDSDNPYAIYIKGTQEFFVHREPIVGLCRIKRAADKGCKFALYTYVLLRKMLYNDDESLSQITREFAMRESSFLFHHRVGRLHVLHALAAARKRFVKFMLPLVYRCRCSPRKSTFSWSRYDAEDSELCDCCFWLSHVGIFSHYFSVVVLPETSLW